MRLFKRKTKLDHNKLPKHIAFILDGNGRWAKKRGIPRAIGHSYGVKAVANTIENCMNLGIKYMSFYTFSTENWKRPQQEINAIFDLLRDYIKKDWQEYENKPIKLVTSGDITKLPEDLYKEIQKVKDKTANKDEFVVNIALNYGGRDEIVNAVNTIIDTGVKKVDKESFKNYLYTKDLPDPDLIIRTSGEVRTSNFMPYQSAYSEWHFPKTFWPDFNKKELEKALVNYQSRNRRFGSIKKEDVNEAKN
jgi:undecaprenyl diphosphate synthase